MKRIVVLVMMIALVASASLFAEQSTLIDFTQLTADYPPDNPTDHEETLLNFGDQAGTVFTEEERALMSTSLAIPNWEIELASSSRFVENQTLSQVRAAQVREDAAQFAGETVLGVRVHFPSESYNSWALIEPPFEIPAYADPTEVQADGTLETPQDQEGSGDKYVGFGVVKNVGTLRTVSMTVHGLNFNHGVSVVLQDENNEEQEVFLGYLNFEGWRTLEWQNPNYITSVRNRELRTSPLYPNLQPMRKLLGIRFYRDSEGIGGDFISYVRDITITYDLATLQLQRDIDDEAVWGILQEREADRRAAELRRLGNVQVLRYLEEQKMHDPDAPQDEE
ncbi:MAG: flagellar filament outer layer protein FlaA [Spirochaetaceae bacterium]